MSWKSFPAWTPALVRRHVVLLVEWLKLANALHRWRSDWASRSLFLVAAGVVLVVASVAFLSSGLVAVLAEYWLLTAVVTAVYAASSVARRRRRIYELHLQSWLIAAPISPTSVRASQAIRTLLPITAQFLAAALLVATAKVIAAMAAGLLVGGVMGWRTSLHRSEARTPGSRYVRSQRTGAQALSAWPISQVFAWSRPENARYILIVALMAVQGGSSALLGLAVVAFYFIGSYLVALLTALMSVARSASVWLRSTPMTLSEFVWVLSRRALMHQVAATALVLAVMVLLGAPVLLALQIAALWIGLVISMSGCALVDAYRGRSPLMKVTLCFVAWTAMMALLHMKSAERA